MYFVPPYRKQCARDALLMPTFGRSRKTQVTPCLTIIQSGSLVGSDSGAEKLRQRWCAHLQTKKSTDYCSRNLGHCSP